MAKRLKAKELVGLSRSELLDKEKALKDELFKLNGQRYSGRVEKPHRFSLVKRELSVVATVLNTKKEK
ncbi:MAG: 50S ribosomal protein L29 [Candidatus Omnitrophota bacterium]|jgi:ribosomal protein L29|nr:50S ribosomal protein L29 [Candidatus Omnitrophota bacterium]MDD5518097.1 50S ribosomal protein L29 [Candidatus Omnitrophota bacterium]